MIVITVINVTGNMLRHMNDELRMINANFKSCPNVIILLTPPDILMLFLLLLNSIIMSDMIHLTSNIYCVYTYQLSLYYFEYIHSVKTKPKLNPYINKMEMCACCLQADRLTGKGEYRGTCIGYNSIGYNSSDDIIPTRDGHCNMRRMPCGISNHPSPKSV